MNDIMDYEIQLNKTYVRLYVHYDTILHPLGQYNYIP